MTLRRGGVSHMAIALVLAASIAFGVFATRAGAADEFSKFGIESLSASLSSTQAGAHADLTIDFTLSEKNGQPYALPRDIGVSLPPGTVGNPQAIPRCTPQQLGVSAKSSECPVDSQVGYTEITIGGSSPGSFLEPIYNMKSPGGDIVARFGFFADVYPAFINVRVNPVDYSLTATIEGAPAAAPLITASTTLWGVPAEPANDIFRITPSEAENHTGPENGRPATLPAAPFMTNSTSCGTTQTLSVSARSYQEPSRTVGKSTEFPAVTGCGRVTFSPEFEISPTNPEASAPTGIAAELRVPQNETPMGLGTSPLKSANVLLPPGFTINPSAGDGLAACSAAEVGFETINESHCPDASKLGTAEIDVPALEHVLHGAVYQRTPEPGNLFRFWLVTDELGAHLKLPAEIKANPATGQIRTLFVGIPSIGGNPEVPVSALKLNIFGGPRAPLSTPATCGTYATEYEFAPWSGGRASSGSAPMQITSGCGKGGFAPRLNAGTVDSYAGHYTPFTLDLLRSDGEGNPQQLSVTLPQGLLAKLGGVPLCPAAAAATGDCPAGSQVGVVAAAAGVGSSPLWIPQPGKAPTAIYLSGPYRGAPYSLVVKVPAQAGPFDLGTVVTRAAIYIDPTTAIATVTSDPLPQILEGVPIAYRDLHVDINRPEFTLNPTGCQAKSINARVVASDGAVATPSAGFQATNCAKLGFAPSLSIKFSGKTKRAGHPAVKAMLTQPPNQAGIAGVTTILPKTEFIDNAHINNPCTRVQFAAEACPKASILGTARALTPLLDQPLEGPVYFRSNGGERELPDLVADLRAGPVHVTLIGYIDSVKKKGEEISQIRTRFLNVPDAPVSKFVLSLYGGKKGLLQNNTNLCKADRRAKVEYTAQNGKRLTVTPVVGVTCGGKKKK